MPKWLWTGAIERDILPSLGTPMRQGLRSHISLPLWGRYDNRGHVATSPLCSCGKPRCSLQFTVVPKYNKPPHYNEPSHKKWQRKSYTEWSGGYEGGVYLYRGHIVAMKGMQPSECPLGG